MRAVVILQAVTRHCPCKPGWVHICDKLSDCDKLSVPNYGERYHNGEAIATGFVESTVNEVVSRRFCEKQQMQWSKDRY